MITRILIILLALLLLAGCSRQTTEPPTPPDIEIYDYTELPSNLKALVPENGPNPTPLDLLMTNAGTCDLDYNISVSTVDGAAWLGVSPMSGILQSGVSGVPKSSTILTVTMDVVTTALTPGTYTGSIILSGTCDTSGAPAEGSPVRISVNLTILSQSASIAVDQSRIEVDIAVPVSWAPTDTGPEARTGHSAVWTGRQMIVWGGSRSMDPADALGNGRKMWGVSGAWTTMTSIDAPSPRMDHAAVWTGSNMIVWGGKDENGDPLYDGGIYDPDVDTWSEMNSADAPVLDEYAAVWTGNEMIVWGLPEGGIYDPGLDSWRTMDSTGQPNCVGATAVWTGDEVLVWGDGAIPGGMYDPAMDSWSPLPGLGAMDARSGHSAVWTGKEMIIWGGHDAVEASISGAAFDPATVQWVPLDPVDVSEARYDHVTVWTGSDIIVWGGKDYGDGLHSDGYAYNLNTESWSPLPTVGSPDARIGHTSVWTGVKMIVWGGLDTFGGTTDTGGILE